MIIGGVQVWCRNELIAFLADDSMGYPRWYIDTGFGCREPIEDPAEIAQLARVITDPDFAGYMIFRAREYEDVVVAVDLGLPQGKGT